MSFIYMLSFTRYITMADLTLHKLIKYNKINRPQVNYGLLRLHQNWRKFKFYTNLECCFDGKRFPKIQEKEKHNEPKIFTIIIISVLKRWAYIHI